MGRTSNIQSLVFSRQGKIKHPQGIIIIFLLCCLLQACGGLKLIDISKSSPALQLTTAQQQTIHPKLKLIRDIVEDYDFEKKQLEVDYQIFRAGMTQRYYDRYESGFMDTRSRRELNEFRDGAREVSEATRNLS